MRIVLSVLLTFLLAFPCAALGEGEAEKVPTLLSMPLPIDFSGGAPLQDEYYEGDDAYMDPTISVKITFRDIREQYFPKEKKLIGVWVVDIRIGDASQLRTAPAVSFKNTTSKTVKEMAERVNAVVAFNGDFAARRTEGIIIRQGETFKNKLKGTLDVLVIDEDGNFHPFIQPNRGEIGDTIDGKKIINAFYFGPVLVNDGEVRNPIPDFTYLRPERFFARLAICQIGELHYKMIISTMQENANTRGIPLNIFAQICKEEGARYAFNLDGGNSASMIFRGELVNAEDRDDPREVPDIVYFASAWNEEVDE